MKEMLIAGVQLMIFGMAVVYVFLTIMIWAMNLLERVLRPYAARFEPKVEKPALPARKSSSDEEVAMAAVAAAAVYMTQKQP